MTEMTLADRFRSWAGDSERVYPHAVRALADDWDAGGVTRAICTGYEDAPKAAVIQLRLLAGVFRLVLNGRAEELRPFYPCLGGTVAPGGIGPVLLSVLGQHTDELRVALRTAPQTNEIGRSAALVVGLADVVGASGRTRVRLLEVGASAGLNLLLDRYAISGDGWHYGPDDSPVQLDNAVEGTPGSPDFAVPDFTIADRRGCDLHPVDPATDAGRLLLTSFVWPDDVHRFERLSAAFAVVDEVGAPAVDPAPAGEWLGDQLERPGDLDVLPVVWNSITEQYWPAEETTAVADLVARFGAVAPVARISMEFRTDSGPDEYPELRTSVWMGDGSAPRERLLGHAHHHGLPVYLNG